MKLKIATHFREPRPSDLGFILNSWLKGVSQSDFGLRIPRAIFFPFHTEVISELLQCSRTIVACSPEEEEQIFGYITYYPDYKNGRINLHYVYVKAPFRRCGLADALKNLMLEEEGKIFQAHSIYTTHNNMYHRILKDKWNLIYNPYLLWKAVYGDAQKSMSG